MQSLTTVKYGGKTHFCVEEVGTAVFDGPLGFWNDIREFSKKSRKELEMVQDETGKNWCDGSTLLKITKWIGKINMTPKITGFIKCLRKNGIYSTRRRISSSVWKEVGFRHKWCCAHCKEMLKPTFELDHIVELERGGSDTIENLQPLCVECHAKKTHGMRLKKVRIKHSPIRKSKYF
jgi:hypothetical protein